jgi:hypothetical protein
MKRFIILSLTLTLTAACATKDPQLQSGPDAEITFDGLVRIDNSVFAYAWAEPDIDLRRYTKILPQRAEFEFRAVRSAPSETARSNQREFPISEKNQEKLIQIVSEVFDEELAKSQRFAITDTPGPDVLLLTGTLLDVVSLVPPERSGRSEVYLSRVAEATLVLELADSMSGETLVRAAERRAAERAGQMAMRANSASSWGEVKRLARRWAMKLREGLDAIDPIT